MAPVRPTATNAESYYAYEGSFTAPPCAEGVAWRVLKNPLPVAAADLLAFRRVQGSNNRPPPPRSYFHAFVVSGVVQVSRVVSELGIREM